MMIERRSGSVTVSCNHSTFRHGLAFGLAILFLLAGSSLVAQEDSSYEDGLVEGRGEYEMVLIHGLGSSSEVWEGVTPYLTATFKVRHFELGGHGETPPIDDPTIEKEVVRLREFIQANDLPYPTIVGHGLGGMVAMTYALQYPADVHRLIVMDSAPRQLIDDPSKLEITKQLLNNYDRFVAERFFNMSPEPDITERIIDQALRTDSATFISLLMSSFDFDVTQKLRGLSVPLLIVGSELMFREDERNREILDQIGFGAAPSLSFKRMAKTGHFMMLERPVYLSSVLLAFGVSADHRFEE